MSTGGSIPYHLRQHKAVERNLFIELLRKLNNYINVSDYVYIGFGGPFLEDFKQLHTTLKINKMISLEMEENVHIRQKFNMPISCVDIGDEPENSGEFITRYDFEEPSLIWLDYAIPKDLNKQLNEIASLISKLKPKDIFKITLNATPDSLGRDYTSPDPKPFRLRKLIDRLTEDYCPTSLEEDDVTFKRFPSVLLKALQRSINVGLAGRSDIQVQPLATFIYKDGQQMITFTGIILPNDDDSKGIFFEKSRIEAWPFFNGNWATIRNISIPTMSLRERMFIEERLPFGSEPQIKEQLGFYLGDDEEEASEHLNNFIEYYKVVPWYSKVLF
ncbi:O-methyltransferase [Lelliottia sp.]|uniref:O-methyltransferase n=1 Tax=Lelliottia sp. TaxID=1898429 RepID=UPI00388F4652